MTEEQPYTANWFRARATARRERSNYSHLSMSAKKGCIRQAERWDATAEMIDELVIALDESLGWFADSETLEILHPEPIMKERRMAGLVSEVEPKAEAVLRLRAILAKAEGKK